MFYNRGLWGVSAHIPPQKKNLGQVNLLGSNNDVGMVFKLIQFPFWNFKIRISEQANYGNENNNW